MVNVDWLALLKVAGVTILAATVIAALMSLSNWLLTVPDGREAVSVSRRILGLGVVGVMVLFLLFGLYLMIPYFHH